MFRLRVFLRSSLTVITKPTMHEPLGTTLGLRAQSTQVRTEMLRADAVVPLPPLPHSVCSNCSNKNSATAVERKATLEEQEQSPQWKPKCILRQPNPTEDLSWDPSDILSCRITVTPEGKVRWSFGSRGRFLHFGLHFAKHTNNHFICTFFRSSRTSHFPGPQHNLHQQPPPLPLPLSILSIRGLFRSCDLTSTNWPLSNDYSTKKTGTLLYPNWYLMRSWSVTLVVSRSMPLQ